MTRIVRQALVPRSAGHMFDLVNEVEAYPRLFSWCPQAAVLERDPESLVARLGVTVGGMGTTFTTRNHFVPAQHIRMQMIDGPFRRLGGEWTFQALGEHGAKVALALDFEFAGALVGSALALGFQTLADRMVDDFVRVALREPA